MEPTLDTLLTDRLVKPMPPAGRQQHGGAGEAEENLSDETDESASASCYIEYVDAAGNRSSRVITLRRIEGFYGEREHLVAYCHLRKSIRRFLLSNVDAMFCTATGVELDPIEHCIALNRQGALKVEDKALARVMRIITFMARCDGEFHALEEDAIDEVLGRYFRFFGGDDVAYDCACRESIRLAPTGSDVIKAVNFISNVPNRSELARFIIRASAEVIDADGRHRDAEVRWGAELGATLRRMADGRKGA